MIFSPSCAYNLKLKVACSWLAHSPFPFASVTDWMLPSTPRTDAFPQIQLQRDTTVGCKVATPLERCVVHVGLCHAVTDTSMNHNKYMKSLDHCLWLCQMAWTTRIFPGWTRFFPRQKPWGKFERKILLAHLLSQSYKITWPSKFLCFRACGSAFASMDRPGQWADIIAAV